MYFSGKLCYYLRVVNGDFEQVWKESVVTYFEILSQHLPGGTEKTTIKPQ